MKSPSRISGIAMAAAAAGLFTTVVTSNAYAQAGTTAQASVQCLNSSACKGKSACKTASNACKGQNACKGKGMTMQSSPAACTAAQAANKS